MAFRRKLYDEMLQWKQQRNGSTALLIRGARRVGKSTLVTEFAKNEYDAHIIIDFSNASKQINALFEDMMDLDLFFFQLQNIFNVRLTERKSVIVFDEVQLQPLAQTAATTTSRQVRCFRLKKMLPILFCHLKRANSRCTQWISTNSAGRLAIMSRPIS